MGQQWNRFHCCPTRHKILTEANNIEIFIFNHRLHQQQTYPHRKKQNCVNKKCRLSVGILKFIQLKGKYRGPDLNRHGACAPQDFKSCASTNSATPARFDSLRTSINLLFVRRRADSNRRIKVLQTSPLPLGYGAKVYSKWKKKRAQKTGRHIYISVPLPEFKGPKHLLLNQKERETGLEPATSTLARLRSTN